MHLLFGDALGASLVGKLVDLPNVVSLCSDCKLHDIFLMWNLYQMTSGCFQFCFQQVRPSVDMQQLVFGVFWDLHEANMFGRVSMTAKDVFVENNIL